MASYGFHSEAAEEYLTATQYYIEHASPLIATVFVAEVEAAVEALRRSPMRWPVIEEPQIRRYLLSRFPYSVYYRWEADHNRVAIYAIMHTSRRPGYWRGRLDE